MEGFDPLFPDDLAKLHPLSCDRDTCFQESGHKYAVKIDGEWTTDDLISVTGWIKTYVPAEEKDDVFKFAAMRQAKSINAEFVAGAPPIVAKIFDKPVDVVDDEVFSEVIPLALRVVEDARRAEEDSKRPKPVTLPVDPAFEAAFDEYINNHPDNIRMPMCDKDIPPPPKRKRARKIPVAVEAPPADGSYPAKLYDKVDREDWEGAMRCAKGESSVAVEFANHIRSDPKFVRMPYDYDADYELREKFAKWKESSKTPEAYADVFGVYEPRVLALPPFLTGNDVRELWPRFGTRLHRDVEHYFNGHPPKFVHSFVEWEQFLRFVDHMKTQNHEPYRTEVTMSVPSLRLCGQADFVARKPDGKFVLYDWKRTASIRADGKDPYAKNAGPMLPPWQHRANTSRNTYEIQLNIYRQMLKSYGVDVDEMYLVCFHKDHKDYQLVPVKCIMAHSPTCPDAAALRRMIKERADAIK